MRDRCVEVLASRQVAPLTALTPPHLGFHFSKFCCVAKFVLFCMLAYCGSVTVSVTLWSLCFINFDLIRSLARLRAQWFWRQLADTLHRRSLTRVAEILLDNDADITEQTKW